MNRRGSLGLFLLFAAVTLLAGCHGDPNVRKQKYLESGKRYSSEGKFREAAIQYSNALKIDKTYPDAHFELGQAYLHLRQYSLAYSELARTVELQPSNFEARIDLGDLLLAAGKIDGAQEQANAVMAAQPDNPDVHALLSSIAVGRKNLDLAMTEIQRALQLDPDRATFHEDLARLQAGDPAKNLAVEDELKKAVALDPRSVNAKLMLTAFYARGKRWPEAELEARSAIATDPKNMASRSTLAQVFLAQGDQAKAEEALRQASNDLADDPQGVRMLADYFVGSRQMDKAKAEFASLTAKYPKNAALQKAYVRVLLEVKDYPTAQTVVSRLMKISPKDPEVAALDGIVLLNNGKTDDAMSALLNASKNYPKDAFIQFWLGKAAQAKGDNAQAEKSFRSAAELNPARLDAEEELARLAAMRGDFQMLEDVADKTIVAAPRFAGGYVWRAIAELVHNSPDKAEADLNTAIGVAPQNPQVYLQLGKLRFSQKRYPEAVSLMEKSLQLDPNSAEALRYLVGFNLDQKQPDKALARLNEQIQKSPNNSNFYDLLAQLKIQSKDLDQAAAAAQKAMQLNAGDGEAVLLFAQIQIGRGQADSAIAASEQWLKTHPTDASATAMLGTLEESQGKNQKAEEYYKRALQIQPSQALAANNLSYLMLQNGENVDVALTLAQTARQGMPTSPATADTLAWAYYYKGTYAFARDLLEDAIKTNSESATMQYHLGMVYAKLKDKGNATAHLRKAVTLAHGSSTAKDAQTALQGLG